MAKISMSQAAKRFAVSRPSLAKHLKSGKISGEKVGENWQLDESELARVYPYRDVKTAPDEPDNLPARAGGDTADLQAEIRVLQAKLEAAEAMAEERAKHLDDLRSRLPAPGRDAAPRRKWWWFGK